MREIFTSGSVGRASGNRRFYPEADGVRGVDLCACSLRSHFRTQTTPHTPRLKAALYVKDASEYYYSRNASG